MGRFLSADSLKFDRYKYIFNRKMSFSVCFWLIFNNTSSENVVAMETREGLSFKFWFQNINYIFLEKSQSF